MTVTLRSSRCCICHAPASNNHHEPPKGTAGDHDDTITLCGFGNADKCHGLAHHNGGTLTLHKPAEAGEPWHFTADKKAAADITKRRRAAGLPSVKEGFRYRIVPVEECEGLDSAPPAMGDECDPCAEILATATETARTLDHSLAVGWRQRAVLLARVREAVGKQQFAEWVTGTLGMSKALASKSLTVVAQLGEESGCHLPAEVQYAAARAVKLGRVTADDAVRELENSSLHDFVERHRLATPRVGREKVLACPECGCAKPISEYEVCDA